MVVQPRLQAVDIHLGTSVPGPSALLRNVGVDPVGRRLPQVDDDRDQRHDGDRDRREERKEHHRDTEAARDPQPRERPHERVQEERDQ